jgi:hypothetical protein
VTGLLSSNPTAAAQPKCGKHKNMPKHACEADHMLLALAVQCCADNAMQCSNIASHCRNHLDACSSHGLYMNPPPLLLQSSGYVAECGAACWPCICFTAAAILLTATGRLSGGVQA